MLPALVARAFAPAEFERTVVAWLPVGGRRAVSGTLAAGVRLRLKVAVAAGCRMLTAGVAPGGASHRNFEQHGFLVAYTSITLIKHPPERRLS